MKIMITGASGFLGSHLAEGFLRDGHAVTLLVRNPDKLIPSLKKCRIVGGDLLDAASVRDAVRGAQVVVHSAACVAEWGTKDDYFLTNVTGTQNIIDVCASNGMKRFIHISSNSVYGDGRNHVEEREEAPYLITGLHYGDSKIEAEKRVFAAHEAGRMIVTAIRPSMIWGPRDRQFLPKIIDALSKNMMLYFNGGRQLAGLTHVENIMNLVRLCLKNVASHGRAYNVDDDDRRTIRDLSEALAVRLGYRKPFLSVPGFVGQAVAAGSEFVWRAAGIKTPPLLTKMGVAVISHHNDVSVERAKRELGYNPQDLFDTRMDAYIRSYQAGE